MANKTACTVCRMDFDSLAEHSRHKCPGVEPLPENKPVTEVQADPKSEETQPETVFIESPKEKRRKAIVNRQIVLAINKFNSMVEASVKAESMALKGPIKTEIQCIDVLERNNFPIRKLRLTIDLDFYDTEQVMGKMKFLE